MGDWRKEAEINADVVYFHLDNINKYKDAPEVFIWDLDKTYLDTRFENLKELFKVILEKAFKKKNIPGTISLLKGLKRSWKSRFGRSGFPIYFITASPPQMKKKILQKLNLDGTKPAGLFCKDNLKNLRPKRFWRLTQQVGYKLQALLQLRENLGEDTQFICWGDDSESDAIIYSLFSDICARRVSEVELEKILTGLSVVGPQLRSIFNLQSRLPHQDPVKKIYINLAEDTDAEYYQKFGRRCVPTYTSFQSALDLYQDGKFDLDQVILVAKDLQTNYYFVRDELEKHFDDFIRRKILLVTSVQEILPALQKEDLIHKYFEPSIEPVSVAEAEEFEPFVPEYIDYLNDYR